MRAFARGVRLVAAALVLSTPLVLSGQSQDRPGRPWSIDARFRGSIVPNNIRENMRRMTLRPHHVGSPYDKDNAEWILARFLRIGALGSGSDHSIYDDFYHYTKFADTDFAYGRALEREAALLELASADLERVVR